MVDWEIMREYVADFQNARGLVAKQNLSEDRGFDTALVFPCLVAEMIEVGIGASGDIVKSCGLG